MAARSMKPFQASRLLNGGESELGCMRKGRRRVGFGVLSEMERNKDVGLVVVVRAVKVRIEESVVLVVDDGVRVHELLGFGLRWSTLKIQMQRFIEKGIVDCRFFTLLAVGGSLLGSVLCFLEGLVIVVKCYARYFRNMGHVVELLIEAIDMFLVGTAMLMFGMGLYAMFVGSKSVKEQAVYLPRSDLFGLFHFRALPAWAQMHSVSQIKSKMGHAIMMVLQVGVLEKLKNVPVVTGLDLACFAGVVLMSSACVFILSKLSANDAAN